MPYDSTTNACAECGTTERPHKAHGLCGRCYCRRNRATPEQKALHAARMREYSKQPHVKAARLIRDQSAEGRAAQHRHNRTPKRRAYQREYSRRRRKTIAGKTYAREYRKRPEVRERGQAYATRPEVKARHAKYERLRYKRGNSKFHIRQSDPTKHILLARDGMLCAWCHQPLPILDDGYLDGQQVHVDHIHPVSKGGADEMGNWQLLHAVCNLSKGSRVDSTRS